MGWWKKLQNWFGRNSARRLRESATDAAFSDSDCDWVTGPSAPATPQESVFAEEYERSRPTGEHVARVMASPGKTSRFLREVQERDGGMKLIVGLGNPGAKYVGTRHNVGYEVLAELGRRFGAGRPKSKFQGELLEAGIAGQRVLLLSPVTYMNLSGNSVRPCLDFFRIAISDVLVICDDVSLPVARIRVRPSGSSGGQKGLKDVIRVLGTENVPRLRVGIGEKPPGADLADYVLTKFGKQDAELIQEAVRTAADAVELWVRDGVEACMNRYNG